MEQFEKIGSYAFEFNPGGQRDYSQLTPEEVGAVVDERALKVLAESPDMGDSAESYMQAVGKVLKADEALKRAYAQTPAGPADTVGDLLDEVLGTGKRQAPLRRERSIGKAGEEVAALVDRLLQDNPDMPYRDAMDRVFKSNPSLEDRYHRGE